MQKKFYESNLKVLLSFQSLVFHNMHWRSNVKCLGKECYEILFPEGNINGFGKNVQHVMRVFGNYFLVGYPSKTILRPKLWHRTANQLLVTPTTANQAFPITT